MSAETPTAPAVSRSFAEEFKGLWQPLPRKLLLGVLLIAWIVFFHLLGNSTLGYVNTTSLFGWLNYAYQNSADDQHGYFIPLVVLGLLWWKRDELAVVPKRIWWPAFALVAGALLLHAAGFLVQQTRVSVVAFFAGLYALTGLVWGGAWLRATFFPFVLFAFAVPLGNTAEVITFPLRMLATKITVALTHGVLGLEVIQNGTSIFEPSGRYSYEVAAACSGIRSLTAIVALAVIFAFTQFQKNWQRAVLISAAFPLAVAANVARLLTIIIAADAFGQHAGNTVHESSWFSLVPYLLAFASLWALGWWLARLGGKTRQEMPNSQ